MSATLECADLANLVQALPLVRECDRIRSGALRMSTPFSYPNGERVDVFLDTEQNLIEEKLLLSDHGQTALYLKCAQVSLLSTARKRELLADILDNSGVRMDGMQFVVIPRSVDRSSLSDAIFRLSQVCMRISDFATHQRLRSTNSFRDDVEEFFDAHNLSWQADVKLPPVFGKREIRMDFEVKSGNKSSYVNVLGAMNEVAAHNSANEIVVKLMDLKSSNEIVLQQFVTVYNSASNAIRPEDIERLQTFSSAISFPEQMETLAAILVDDTERIHV